MMAVSDRFIPSLAEQDSAASITTDTLTQSYSGEWQAMEQMEQSSGFIQWMASNDLIFVVLGVSLLIWFVLLFFMIRIDRKLTRLENTLPVTEGSDHAGNTNGASENEGAENAAGKNNVADNRGAENGASESDSTENKDQK